MRDERDDDAPVHRRGGATDEHEPADVALLPAAAAAAESGATAATPPPRTICLCADDFGLHAAVDDAVLRLAAGRRLHAAGVMVGAIAARRDGARAHGALRELAASGIDVGLHLDFTQAPLLPHGGARRSWQRIAAAGFLRRLDTAAIGAEIAAQLDAFEQAVCSAPAYVDGHEHVHQLPGVREALLAELARRPAARGCWLRSTRCAPGAGFKARVIESLGASAFTRLARRAGHGHNGRLLGVYDFGAGPPGYLQRLAGWLRASTDGDLLMCHPADGPVQGDAITAARQREFSALGSAAFGELLRRERVELAPMSRLVAAPPAHQS